MISKRLIDQGVKIRSEFLNINNQLEDILAEIHKVGMKLNEHTKELEDMNTNIDRYSDAESAKMAIFDKLSEVELEGSKLVEIYKPVNDKLEDLKSQEESLYRIIKETYPNLTDEDIVREFEPYLKK